MALMFTTLVVMYVVEKYNEFFIVFLNFFLFSNHPKAAGKLLTILFTQWLFKYIVNTWLNYF